MSWIGNSIGFFFVNIGNSIGRGLEWSLKDQMNIESFGLCACSKNLSTLHVEIKKFRATLEDSVNKMRTMDKFAKKIEVTFEYVEFEDWELLE